MATPGTIELRLADLGRILTGRTPPSEVSAYFGAGCPFVTPSDMREQKYIRETERQLSDDGRTLLARCSVPAGSVMVSCIGWQMGKVALTDRESVTNQQLNTIVPNERVLPDYLYYSLCTRRDELKRLGSVGTRTPIVNKSVFSSLKIQVPSLAAQRRIVDVLSPYDDLIENSERRIRALDEMARSLYQEWFVAFRFPGCDHATRTASSMGPIPKTWRAERFGALVRETRQGVPKGPLPDGPTPLVGLEHIPRRSLALDDWEDVTELGSNKLRFEAGEILFGKIRPYFHKVSIAPFAGVCSADTFVLSSIDPNQSSYVRSVASSDQFVAHASAAANGAKMPRASWDVMAAFPVAVPPPALLSSFARVVEPWLADQQCLVFQIHNLRKTRDLLLPRLLSGQLSGSGAA